ncbi:MAG: hypothetical protein Q9219_005235 [cf. Caloplaca sp. 3 TL-2023]
MSADQNHDSASNLAVGNTENSQILTHSEDHQPWSEEFVHSTITSYLTDSLSPRDTALALTTPINRFLSSDSEETDDSPDEFAIWSAIFAIVRQYPHSSPAIPALVALLGAIKDTPTPTPLKRNGMTYWTDLPHFGWEARENWNRTVGEADDSQGYSCSVAQWASMNAFVAQLTVADVSDFRMYCIWALRDALEEVPGERSKTGHVTDLDNLVPAAAVWMLVAGSMVYAECIGSNSEERTKRGGPLWEGGPILERWRFWKQRFEWVVRQEEVAVKGETRDFARLAAERMEEVDKAEGAT